MSVRFCVLLFLLSCFSCSKRSHKILYIADAKVNCDANRYCLQIKEIGADDWQFLNSPIEGFEFHEGQYYKIEVEVADLDKPSAEGLTQSYKLIQILEQSKGPLMLDNGAWMVTLVQNMDSFGRNPFIRIDRSKNQISGNTGCNRFSGTMEIVEEQVSFSQISSTEMMCREMKVEQAFLTTLKEVSTYKIAENKLQFFDKHQKVIMEAEYLKSE